MPRFYRRRGVPRACGSESGVICVPSYSSSVTRVATVRNWGLQAYGFIGVQAYGFIIINVQASVSSLRIAILQLTSYVNRNTSRNTFLISLSSLNIRAGFLLKKTADCCPL